MKWKILVLVLLIVAIASMVGFSYYFGGPNYVEIMQRPFGQLTSYVTKVLFNTNDTPFLVVFDGKKSAFNNMNFQLVNSTVKAEGNVVYMKIDGKTVNKANKIVIGNINGELSISEGAADIKGETTSLSVNDVFFTSEKNMKVEIGVAPDKLFASSILEDKLAFSDTSGKLTVGLKTPTITNLENGRLEISRFAGSLNFDEATELSGTATKVVVNGQEISVTLQ